MSKQGVNRIESLRRRWIAYQLSADVVLALGIGLLTGGLGFYLMALPVIWGLIIFAVALTVLVFTHKPWNVHNSDIAGYLSKEYPDLQESTDLLLQPAVHMNTLQLLARSQAKVALDGLKVSHAYFAKRFKFAVLLLLGAVVLVWVVGKVIPHHHTGVFWSGDKESAKVIGPSEKVLPQIDGVELIVNPPAYTGKGKRTQDRFNLTAEEGAVVHWSIKTNIVIKKAYLIFNDKERIALRNMGEGTEWSASRMIDKPGFYQVSIDGKLSDLYQMQVVKDGPPVIHVKVPKQYTYIDAGEVQQVNISAALNDDYGIANALIIATVAKGRGEGVKFKEYKLNFNTTFGDRKAQYDVQKLIRLPALNMEPGDELYFYVQAQDTHQQQSRTDVFTVAIQDTAELLSMDGVLSGANLKPEFFRSERQIIIDAETLLKEKDTISVEKFNARSNDLGVDQKLLRLRYGKFLGEEDETVEGPKGADNLASPEDFSNASKILKEYTDDHDKADDAQFFEPAVKAQLKATLTEMWKAELQLRLYKPQAALPFAYKALRLLKDLQQKSRSFVAKTSYNSPPLKPEKRLSGELDKIIQPANRQDIKAPADNQLVLKNAVGVLEILKLKPLLATNDTRTLQLANQRLSEIASMQPGAYLPALGAMRRILSLQKISLQDVNTVERAIQKTLSAVKITPKAAESSTDMGLSKSYYKNLKQVNN
ncbi:DUF4175 family protein [Mucilaginibacter glaciei]|uniref:DUF4175 family protein n=1 Tax=Mucilaginibacter glaciei TaxID=2772109 RepID=A0A926NK58_9SPHI|nr:DUF4175 family protein [Mucilaginibacter glaciei]MBD1392721.1 hypothetical protein [Mucilaginibacter glaciei]